MAMRQQRLRVGQRGQLFVSIAVPERKWQRAHQRAVSVAPLIRRTGRLRRHAVFQVVECPAGLDAYIKHVRVDSKIAIATSRKKFGGQIRQIETVFFHQRVEQAGRERAIVRSGAWFHAPMRAAKTGQWRHVDHQVRGWRRQDGTRKEHPRHPR